MSSTLFSDMIISIRAERRGWWLMTRHSRVTKTMCSYRNTHEACASHRQYRGFSSGRRDLQQASDIQQRHEGAIMTKETVSQFEDGTHPWLQKPISTRHSEKLKVNEIRAPHTGVIRLIVLNEMKAANALGKTLVTELEREIDIIHEEGPSGPTRALVIASEHDKIFCAGANLKERASMSIDEANEFLTQLRRTFTKLADLPVPVIAAVHGYALGGGLELALCAHLRVFGTTAVVGLPETRLGIIPGAGGTFRLPAAVGQSRALEMILSARRVNATESLNIGLCHEIVTEEEEKRRCGTEPREARARIAVRDKAIALAATTALGGPVAIRAALRAIKGGCQQSENDAYADVIKTDDRNEALRAFAAKTLPIFKGH